MDVLILVMALAGRLEVWRIVGFLVVAPSLVESGIFRTTSALFILDPFQNVDIARLSFETLLSALSHPIYIYYAAGALPDTIFTQLLSSKSIFSLFLFGTVLGGVDGQYEGVACSRLTLFEGVRSI